MRIELVEAIIWKVSAGNPNMRVVLEVVRKEAPDEIAEYSNTRMDILLLAQGLVGAVSSVVGGNIDFENLRLQRNHYWETNEGKENAVKIKRYAGDLCRRVSEIKASRVSI